MEPASGQCGTAIDLADRSGERVVPRSHAFALPKLPERNALLYQLLILNIVLQVFDGIATYAGLNLGIHEGNPLLRSAFHLWGVIPALLVVKCQAVGLLLFLYRIAGEQLAMPALGMLAGVYSACSLIPWIGVFLMFLARHI